MNKEILKKMIELENKYVDKAKKRLTLMESEDIRKVLMEKEKYFEVNIEFLYFAYSNLRSRLNAARVCATINKNLYSALDEILKLSKGALTSSADLMGIFKQQVFKSGKKKMVVKDLVIRNVVKLMAELSTIDIFRLAFPADRINLSATVFPKAQALGPREILELEVVSRAIVKIHQVFWRSISSFFEQDALSIQDKEMKMTSISQRHKKTMKEDDDNEGDSMSINVDTTRWSPHWL